MMSTETLGVWRSRFWPIHRFELKKLLPLLFMKFLISLNYAILTCMKDAMVVTAKGSGAEVIPVLKGWVVLPIALLATLLYTKLSNHFKQTTMFYLTLGGFLSLILAIAFILYPHADILSPTHSADRLGAYLNGHGGHWIAVYRNWIPSLFFVTAELWGSFVIFMLFWCFINQISTVSEAKRTYTLYIAAGDLASVVTGPLVWHYARKWAHVDFAYTLQSLSLWLTVFGLLIMAAYFYITRSVMTDTRFALPDTLKGQHQKKNSLSLLDSLKHIARSRYLFSIAVMVIGYGLCINMIEVSWKANLKLLHPEPIHYQAYMGTITTVIGSLALITVLLVGGGMLRSLGWRFSAQITPLVVGTTGVLFFLLLILRHHLSPTVLGFSPLFLIVTIGAIQNVSSKVMKYTFFDPTKEMAFIPLDQESKTKGKAAIDVVGSRLGKSGSAWIQIALIDLLGTGSILSVTHFLMPIVLVMVMSWLVAVRYVNRQFKVKEKQVL